MGATRVARSTGIRCSERPEQLADVLRDLEVHGIAVDRIVVTLPVAQLSADAKDALAAVEMTSTIRVDYIAASLGLDAALTVTRNEDENRHLHLSGRRSLGLGASALLAGKARIGRHLRVPAAGRRCRR